jgi:TRAP-type C4-dicarboxylate transport system permease small subunit
LNRFTCLVQRVSAILDKLAGICIFSVMLLIMCNIIFRAVFSQPILGTYELVGFLTALGVSFALAQCSLQDGHIAVSFVMEKFSLKIQFITAFLVNFFSLIFWSVAAWYLCKFGQTMKMNGLVSPSAEVPVYYFIYLIAIGIIGLCLVLFIKLLVACRELFGINRKMRTVR